MTLFDRERKDKFGTKIPGQSDKVKRPTKTEQQIKARQKQQMNPPKEGEKRPHQITFRDKVIKGQRVVDVYPVESYKVYNVL